MSVLALSVDHRGADLDVLAALGRDPAVPSVLLAAAAVRGAVRLATCNRYELYLDVAGDDLDLWVAADAATEALAASSGLSATRVGGLLRPLVDRAATEHLFAVAAGLESMVVGEREVTGQVRRASADARAGGTLTPLLDRLVQGACRTARLVHRGTDLAGHDRSIVGVALELAARSGFDWPAARVVLVGTGSYARTSLTALRARGCRDVVVHSPSGRAGGFAAEHALTLVSAPGLTRSVAAADLLLACSGSGALQLDLEAVAARRPAAAPPLVVVDLGLRRDVDRDRAVRSGFRVVDLHAVSAASATRTPVVAAARAIVAAAVDDLELAAERRAARAPVLAGGAGAAHWAP